MRPLDEWLDEPFTYPVEAYARKEYQRGLNAKKEYADFLTDLALGHAQKSYGEYGEDVQELASCLRAAKQQRAAFEQGQNIDEKQLYAILDMVFYVEYDGEETPFFERYQ